MRAYALRFALACLLGLVVPATAFAQDDFDDEFGDEFGDTADDTDGDTGGGGDDFDDDFGDDFDDDFGDGGGIDEDLEDAEGEDGFGDDFEDEDEDEDEDGEEGASGPRDAEELRNQRLRAHSTLSGPVGGVHVVDASPGAAQAFRVGLTTDFFFAGDYLNLGDQNDHIGGYLTLSWTVHEWVEIFASIISYANANDTEEPALFQVLGDTLLGVKFGYDVSPIFTLG
ncbi:MAG: hypothetical protein GWN73_33200, partial [Actinobacteria bacterium]|nr:hypothetical protein [Actinomycetota bacterium]NIU69981.1 hypothetical protein [Actinomycetota bacterium]